MRNPENDEGNVYPHSRSVHAADMIVDKGAQATLVTNLDRSRTLAKNNSASHRVKSTCARLQDLVY